MDRFIEFLSEYIDENRMKHSLETANKAVELAKTFGADEEKAYVAGLLHDVAKGKCKYGLNKLAKEYGVEIDEYERNNPELIHGKLGAKIVSVELSIKDEDILNAIRWHTTGRENMSLLEKIIYIADITEPSRDFKDIDKLRELSKKDINAAMIKSLSGVIEFVECRGLTLHPNSKKALEYLLKEEKEKLGYQQ